MTLIERLEAAERGSRELDIDIYKVTSGLVASKRNPDWIGPDDEWNHGSWKGRAPLYTTSFDAAIILIPEGSCWTAEGSPKVGGIVEVGTSNGPKLGIAKTVPLAICIAALRAREVGNE